MNTKIFPGNTPSLARVAAVSADLASNTANGLAGCLILTKINRYRKAFWFFDSQSTFQVVFWFIVGLRTVKFRHREDVFPCKSLANHHYVHYSVFPSCSVPLFFFSFSFPSSNINTNRLTNKLSGVSTVKYISKLTKYAAVTVNNIN